MIPSFVQKVKISLILTVLGIFIFGFVCTGIASHISMHDPAMNYVAVTISGTDQQECCNTSISKNIESWKSTILVVPRETRDGLLILILGLMATLAVGLFRFRKPFSNRQFSLYRLYERDNPNLALFDHLKLAFARGILNPKIY